MGVRVVHGMDSEGGCVVGIDVGVGEGGCGGDRCGGWVKEGGW